MHVQVDVTASELAEQLADARTRTLNLIADLSDEQLIGPLLEIVNPLLWEIGHMTWFQEKWVLRHLGKQEPVRPEVDDLYDSFHVAHDTRWDLGLPSREETLSYMEEVLNVILDRLQSIELTPEEVYFHRLALYHEDMHGEAFTYTRQTLGYPKPRLTFSQGGSETRPYTPVSDSGGDRLPDDVEVAGGTFLLGATRDQPFVFDNEKWAHPVEVQLFRIARAPVTNGQFEEFVEAGGYRNRRFWSDEGWRWCEDAGAKHPVYWERSAGGRWKRRDFDRLVPLEERYPVIHINWHEAQAYCRWAGRRLPTEAEWEMSASVDPGTGDEKRRFPWGDEPPTPDRANLDSAVLGCIDVAALPAGDGPVGCRQMIGNVWEWTSSAFEPYPGFEADPYKEYSEPWFGTRKVLRGGSWATRSRLIWNTWRNYFPPDRRDIFAGFRTCALDAKSRDRRS